MVLTKFWLEQKFNELNNKCMEEFGMTMPLPNLVVNNSRKAFGFCCYRPSLKQPHTIKVSRCHNRSEAELEQTLLHEMIHYYFNLKGMIREGHGRNFQRMARQMDKYGYNIHTTSSFDYTKDSGKETALLKLIKFESKGKVWLCVINDKYFDRMLKRVKATYTNVQTYTSTNKMFTSFPCCRTRLSTRETYTHNKFETEIMPYLSPTNL